jgi:ubiquinone/menaquinone biosynthesis C-methylase UbiE
MTAITEHKAKTAGLSNVRTYVRDFVADGTGLPEASVQYVMLFNILHAECPDALLREARRILAAGGKLGIVHWNYNPTTPRGPAIGPPARCQQFLRETG